MTEPQEPENWRDLLTPALTRKEERGQYEARHAAPRKKHRGRRLLFWRRRDD